MSRLPANVSRFTFEIIGQSEPFKLLAFRGREGLSSLFEYQVEVLCSNAELPLRGLLGSPAVVTLVHADHPRVIHGMMVTAKQKARVGQEFVYEFTLAPQLYSLVHRSGHRIFQQESVQDIVTRLLKDAGFEGNQYRWDLKAPGAAREYCVQYGETEFDFIARLLAEEGIHFHFVHSLDKHCLVFSDHVGLFRPIPGNPQIGYCQEERGARDESMIRQLNHRRRVTVNDVNVGDYSFEKPNLSLRTTTDGGGSRDFGDLESYQYRLARCRNEGEANRLKTRLQESHSSLAETIGFHSDDTRLAVGSLFEVREHPRTGVNQSWLLVDYRVEGHLPQSAEALANPQVSEFSCQGTAIPKGVLFRPPLPEVFPRVRGVQTAVVTGPSSNEIYTDKHGRIKVQFHWDRHGQADEKTSCWLRVSQGLAGKSWGALALPRVGQEVIVSFEEGDPSRPLVTGSVYNSINKPPYALPRHKSRSGIKTQSSERGSGFNELRIEDRKDKEKLFLRAEKNLDIRVKNRWQQWVKGDHHQQVKKNNHTSVSKDCHQTVQGNLNQKTGQNLSFSSGKDMQMKISGAEVIQVGNMLHIKGGMRTVLQAGMSLSVKVGGSFITLDPSGVSITGPVVRINEGGGGGSAGGASPQAPEMPVLPDDDNAGKQESLPDPTDPHDWDGLTFQRGAAKKYTLESAARSQAAFVAQRADTGEQTPPPELTQARKNVLAETFAEWAQWQDDTMESFDQVGEDPATPELIRFAAAALKTPAKLGTGIVSGAAGLGQLLTDPKAREALVDGVVDLYENPGKIADAAEDFASQPGHEIAFDLFAFGGEMVLGGGAVGKAGKMQKAMPDAADSPGWKKADDLDGGFHDQAAGNRVVDQELADSGESGKLYDPAKGGGSDVSGREVDSNTASLLFNSQADPLLDSMGPAKKSHPAEYKAILDDLEANNVTVKYGDDSIAFSPNTAGGPSGNEILLPNEFSISALRHEYGHFLDHQALGYPRYIEYFKKPELILSTERRQYLGEIRTAREVGDVDARKALIKNYLNEKNYIVERYYQRPYGGKVNTRTLGGN